MYQPELTDDSRRITRFPWDYKQGGPNREWAIIAAGISAVIGVGLLSRFNTRRSTYMAPAIAAQFALALLFLSKFIAGAEWTHIAYAFDRLFMTLCACVFMSTNYAIIGKLATSLNVDKYLVYSKKPLGIFGISDAMTFCIQGLAILLASVDDDSVRYRSYQVVQAGIVLQFISFTYFLGTLAIWLKRVDYYERELWQSSSIPNPPEEDNEGSAGSTTPMLTEGKYRWWKDWRVLVAAVVFSSTALLLRLAYRIFRSRQNFRNDRFFWESMSENQDYLFELIPTLLSIAVFIVIWPQSYIKDEVEVEAQQVGESVV